MAQKDDFWKGYVYIKVLYLHFHALFTKIYVTINQKGGGKVLYWNSLDIIELNIFKFRTN